jgi:2-dehydro-3-deoxygalactonokinase
MFKAGVIALDWGTTSFRAYRLNSAGESIDERKAPAGISTVPTGGFPAVMHEQIGDWLAKDRAVPVIMAGMVGSRNGWVEAPYAALPADVGSLKKNLLPVTRPDGGQAYIVPGLAGVIDGMGEVMRGEETLAMGLDEANALFLTPGTHPKWITLENGRITRFKTFLTGEFFAVLTDHSLLGRLMEEPASEAEEWAGFRKGLAMADDPAGLSHAAFAARSDVLLGRMAAGEVRSYLSGLLIGTEILGAKRSIGLPRRLILNASGQKAAFYENALAAYGVGIEQVESDTILLNGLKRIVSAS